MALIPSSFTEVTNTYSIYRPHQSQQFHKGNFIDFQDILQLFCGDTNQAFLKDPLPAIPLSTKPGYVKPKHDLFLTLAKWFVCQNLARS